MIKWYIAMFIGSASVAIGYKIGCGRAKALLREAERLMSEMGMVLKAAEDLNKDTKEILDEQQTEGRQR